MTNTISNIEQAAKKRENHQKYHLDSRYDRRFVGERMEDGRAAGAGDLVLEMKALRGEIEARVMDRMEGDAIGGKEGALGATRIRVYKALEV